MTVAKLMLAVAAFMLAAPAAANVYVAQRAVGTGTLDLRLVTDGTRGRLDVANVLSWTIGMTVGGRSFVLTPDNSILQVQGTVFRANPDGVFFDFEQGDNDLVRFASNEQGAGNYQLFGPSGGGPGGESLQTGPAEAFFTVVTRTDFGVIALAEQAPPLPVPEPASWALMIAGFGLAGAGLRRAHSVTAKRA